MSSNPFDYLIDKVRSVDIDRRRHWNVLRTFNAYRCVLGLILVSEFYFQTEPIGEATDRNLALWLSLGLLGTAVLGIVGCLRRRPVFRTQSIGQILIDIALFSALGLVVPDQAVRMMGLLAISIAAAGVLLPLVSVLTLALCAWLVQVAIKGQVAWVIVGAEVAPARLTAERLQQLMGHWLATVDLPWLAAVGGLFVGAACAAYFIAECTRQHENDRIQELQDLLELSKLNQAIVHDLQTGLIVVDRYARIRLLNIAARELLDISVDSEGMALGEVSPLLSQRLASWLSISLNNPRPFRQKEHLPDITPTFAPINFSKRTGDTLIALEDSAQAAQRLQQIKMVALGRLTASIAHEVRNPLASISHAAQLLQESPTASSGDKRLGHIIHDNAKRANVIIANVLDLSRREKAKPEEFMLEPWLTDFRQEFLRGHSPPVPEITLKVSPNDLVVRFDANHLRQVLWHLLTNACAHSTESGAAAVIQIEAKLDPSLGFSRPLMTVRDNGPGIPESESHRIFEPFYTTKTQGSGLGLYVSREICEANRSQLQYVRDVQGGCFKITFPAISKHEKLALRTLRKVALH